MTIKKIELKVAINCSECKTQVMKAVTKLQGVDQVTVDAEKGIVTVIGEVDPVSLTKQMVRNTKKHVEIISVGPPKPAVPNPDPNPTPVIIGLPISCPHVYISTYDSYDRCSIL